MKSYEYSGRLTVERLEASIVELLRGEDLTWDQSWPDREPTLHVTLRGPGHYDMHWRREAPGNAWVPARGEETFVGIIHERARI